MTTPPKPHPENAPGDFYVEEDCCITCGIPLDLAPEVFAWAKAPDSLHCVVACQPKTKANLDQTLVAMWAAEADCIRYRGTDPEMVRRIVEMGHAELCDEPISINAAPLVRNHVRFAVDEGAFSSPQQISEDFLRYFCCPPKLNSSRKGSSLQSDERHAIVQMGWVQDHIHSVVFEKLSDMEWHVETQPKAPEAGIGLSTCVEDWLNADARFRDIRWFSRDQWQSGHPGQPTVI